MRTVFGLILILGVALAGGAVMMAKKYISSYQQALAQERAARVEAVPTVDIFVATEELKYGHRLTKENVRQVRWPQESLPEGVFTSLEALFPPGADETPRVILRTMEKNEAIMASKVTLPGEDAGITSRLERGMRAFAIRVDVSSGVSGFLRPGDKVDIYWTGQVRQAGAADGEFTRLIETNVELIAVDQKANSDISGAVIARTVTVAAKPEQVAALAQAQSTGKLTLALVGAGDDTVASVIEVDQRKLLGLGAIEVQPEVEREKVCTVRTRRGAEVVEIPIPCTN
ncbi:MULTISPECIES: Flp pilus assembly protein CpaB [unclassified Leisingera]|uniref:Flp pilus assembly protein CpaB n=1 Tax=unclassified Leisingera TaxID=2614906 RepID=UPI0002D8F6CC|nr:MULTISPECIES: Flp pilus assembly protein CpaB [unclassified Leisingera]KIC16032.1 pilus assembly protein CpaB [Leisingera sp. ANG-DT]KIC26171.1 pilus assembly protein CpaB [Leisingera sp. ANG-S3]KIC30789.1 pilus assembly protein CpaB [Leisingera sp. ANG-M6]KIC30865.1 pilus assembly protein CpaB [Leisingera sp. ANG-S5]KIC55023.1 pilus assembly protein CpaB [Leisingera sp. ANG-S]